MFRLAKYRANKHGLHNRSQQDNNSYPRHAPPKYNESFHIYLSIIQAIPLCDAGRFLLYSHAPPFLLLQVEIPAIRCYNKDIIFGKDSGKGKDMGYILKTAQYVNDFQCIGGKCTMDCCHDWSIIWSNDEVNRLKESQHSAKLDNLITNSFSYRSATTKMIKPCKDGDCPFHNKNDGLCQIQKELGAEYLSLVCKFYPVCGVMNNNVLMKSRVLSCPAVFDIITSDEKSCDVYAYEKKTELETQFVYKRDTVNDVKNNPGLKYRNQLFDFFYGILSDKKRDIHTSMIIGTLAAQTLSKLENSSPDRIPEGITALTKQINSPALVKSLSDIEPNYQVKLGTVQCMLDGSSVSDKLSEIISSIKEYDVNGLSSVDVNLYINSFDKFKKMTANKPFIIKNITRCLYMCQLLPYSSKEYNLFDNYAYFCASVALVDFFASASAAGTDDKDEMFERFRTAVCLSSHALCHNTNRVKMVVEYLKNIDCYSAGHLALIVK